MNSPLYSIPGSVAASTPAEAESTESDRLAKFEGVAVAAPRTVNEVLAQSQVESVMDELERDLIGLLPVKQRIRDIAALLVIDKLRLQFQLAPPACT
jgi:hypothetical protein